MARRRRRRSTRSNPKAITGSLIGLVLLGVVGKLYQVVAASPLLGIPGLVLVVVGILAIVWLVVGRRTLKARTLADLLALTPTQFEEATASLLRQIGYKDVRHTGGAGDLNVDVWARDAKGGRVAVQCKQYRPGHNVGSPEVQTFIGMMFQHHGADRGIFVTTAGFTAPAVALARKHNIALWDGDELARRLSEAHTNPSAPNDGLKARVRLVAAVGLPLGMLLLASASVQSDRVTAGAPTARAAATPNDLRLSPARLTPTSIPNPAPQNRANAGL
jgi:restriction system protein